ncbi:hypothetical protein [Brucella tritici]|uniref:Uncharacterized protein n=1 Tax=Brucella tritici TaxID=94626 RepID=A0A6L3YB59_9HYPH|nr:hypothetical protein [Brucella tritici]KAB2680524.1 hypothetical protein F9L08_20965 [Brucella tritici]
MTIEPRMDGLPVDCQFLTVRVPDGHDQTQPIPLRIRVDYDNPNCFATANGKRVFVEREWAEKSMLMDTEAYSDAIRRRVEASRLVKATIVENWNGWITCTGDEDDYFDSVDSLLERYADRAAQWKTPDGEDPTEDEIKEALPAWAFCTTEELFHFDIVDAVENYLSDNHHDDARDFITGWDQLEKFWKSWSAKQTNLTSYFIDYSSIVVIDPERFAAELVDAQQYLEGNRP